MAHRKIQANGWRQGSFLKKSDFAYVLGEQAGQQLQNCSLIVISQDCDLVHSDFSTEPSVELITATEFNQAPDGRFTYGKNPRRLHLIGSRKNDATITLECIAKDKFLFDRALLSDLRPDTDFALDERNLNILKQWLADRYTRTAFPDAFNNRLRSAYKSITRTLKIRGENISAVYVAIKPWDEIDATQTYEMSIFVTMCTDDYNDTSKRDPVLLALDDIVKNISVCSGVKITDHDVIPENGITLDDIRYLKMLDFDYLSSRDSPGGKHAVTKVGGRR